ncbi:carbohydrate-binding protein [Niabella sp. W65]|nr:carbohydrate-binding protein [Niabella sp. W65]MCH7363447.1 carbohydrate-binding protein [Niabella sp. W65]ULT46437.1 carbohydrate-binding protein [Niabella sp. I65]
MGYKKGGFVKVKSVDFGSAAPKTFTASLAAGLDGGILEVYVDSIGGPKLATIDVPRTGGWSTWKKITVPVTTPVTGVKELYFAFKDHNLTAGRNLFNFDYWLFDK